MIRIDLFFYSQDKFIPLDKWIKKGLDSSSAIKKIDPILLISIPQIFSSNLKNISFIINLFYDKFMKSGR